MVIAWGKAECSIQISSMAYYLSYLSQIPVNYTIYFKKAILSIVKIELIKIVILKHITKLVFFCMLYF